MYGEWISIYISGVCFLCVIKQLLHSTIEDAKLQLTGSFACHVQRVRSFACHTYLLFISIVILMSCTDKTVTHKFVQIVRSFVYRVQIARSFVYHVQIT